MIQNPYKEYILIKNINKLFNILLEDIFSIEEV